MPDLTSAVEEMGYESKNTSQVIRMTVGRSGKFKKMEGDGVGPVKPAGGTVFTGKWDRF